MARRRRTKKKSNNKLLFGVLIIGITFLFLLNINPLAFFTGEESGTKFFGDVRVDYVATPFLGTQSVGGVCGDSFRVASLTNDIMATDGRITYTLVDNYYRVICSDSENFANNKMVFDVNIKDYNVLKLENSMVELFTSCSEDTFNQPKPSFTIGILGDDGIEYPIFSDSADCGGIKTGSRSVTIPEINLAVVNDRTSIVYADGIGNSKSIPYVEGKLFVYFQSKLWYKVPSQKIYFSTSAFKEVSVDPAVIEEQLRIIGALNNTLQDQINLINDLELNIEEKAIIINSLELTLNEQTLLIDSLELSVAEKAVIIDELELTVINQVHIIEELTLTVDEQAIMINQLTANVEEKARLIEALTASTSEQTALILALNAEVVESAEIINALNLVVEEDAQIISGLELSVLDQGVLINELELSVEEQAELINALNLVIADDSIIISQLELSVSEQASLINALNLELSDDALIISQLQLTITEQQALISELSIPDHEKDELKQEINSLEVKLAKAQNTNLFLMIIGGLLVLVIIINVFRRRR